MLNLSGWFFQDLGYRKPSEFPTEEARAIALQDSDLPEEDEEVQTTILVWTAAP